MKIPFVYKSIEEIRSSAVNRNSIKSVRIMLIDDKKPDWYDGLIGYGFKIVHKKDLNSIAECTDYDVVMCDVKDVGQHLAGNGQGAFLAAQIKSSFPDKYVILYTSGQLAANQQKHSRSVDEFLGRSTDLEGWKRALDTAVEQSLSPYYRWCRARKGLLDEGASLKVLMKMEDGYVRAIKKGKPELFQETTSELGGVKETTHLLGSISSFLALFI